MSHFADLFSQNLTMSEHLAPVMNTHMGQAHFAGTGPDNKTCRECAKWYRKWDTGKASPHVYKGRGKGVLYLQPAHCNHPILNKAGNYVPHDALACRLFAQEESPPASTRPDRRFKQKSD